MEQKEAQMGVVEAGNWDNDSGRILGTALEEDPGLEMA